VRKTLAKIIRCKIVRTHAWHPARIEGQDARVCRLCGKRDFDPLGPTRDEALRDLEIGVGGGGGSGM
jgi:hypothetical protein